MVAEKDKDKNGNRSASKDVHKEDKNLCGSEEPKGGGNGEDREVLEKDMLKKMGKGKVSDKNVPGEELLSEKTEKSEEEKLEIEELEEEIELLRKELDGYKKIEDEYIDRIKRLQADYDNYRKRTLKEQIEHIRRANKDLIEKLLPVIDSFENALEMGKDLKSLEDDFYRGVSLIYEKLMEVLKKEGVKIVDPEGEQFNPQTCEAVATEVREDVEEGTILEVFRKGYMINDFLIRPAVVKVSVKSKE
ncbi:MAG: nucleotide exchange factor GrpE [Actinobacteria bacterium]|nr:nucleotide exchange factor GrpE [Actinomycetota bacterium]